MLPKLCSLTSCSADIFAHLLTAQNPFTVASQERKPHCVSRLHIEDSAEDLNTLIARHHEYFPPGACASLGTSKQTQQIRQGEADVHLTAGWHAAEMSFSRQLESCLLHLDSFLKQGSYPSEIRSHELPRITRVMIPRKLATL
jgi:hypothetical protein